MQYIIISFLVFFLSIYLFNKYGASLKFTELNFCTYVFWYEIIAETFVSCILVITKTDEHYIISRVSDSARFYGWISVLWLLVAIPLGMSFGRGFTGVKSPNKFFRSYVNRQQFYYSENIEKLIYYVIIALTSLTVLATVYYSLCIGGITIFRVARNPSLMFGTLRGDIKRNFNGIEYIKNVFSITLSPLCTVIWYCYYNRNKNKKNKSFFYISLITTIIALTNSLEKAPVFFFFLKLLFVYVMVKGKIPLKIIIIVGIIILSLMVCIYIFLLQTPVSALLKVNSGIMGRIFLSQSAGLYCSFEYFPKIHEHLGFSSFSGWFTSILGVPHSERSARICMQIFNPKGVAAGTAGVMNSIFMAESWANFGIWGVILAPIFVGLFVHVLFFSLLKFPKHPIYVGLICYLSSALPFTGGINDFIIPISVLIILTIILLIKLFAKMFYRSVMENRRITLCQM